jgi:hypothetical protein
MMSNFEEYNDFDEENDDLEDINEEDLTQEQSEMVANAYLSFTDKFADYIRQMDPNLFKRAVDYAKTFTEEDIPGISLSYYIPEEEEKEPEQE